MRASFLLNMRFLLFEFYDYGTKFYWYSLKNHNKNLEELDFSHLTFYMYLIVHVFGSTCVDDLHFELGWVMVMATVLRTRNSLQTHIAVPSTDLTPCDFNCCSMVLFMKTVLDKPRNASKKTPTI